jgi:AcrR family transcriptional regulator
MSEACMKPEAHKPLTRQQVLEEALRLIDEEGLEACSMRKLGARLGVEAMSLYYHVENKRALLDGVVESLVLQMPLPPLYARRSARSPSGAAADRGEPAAHAGRAPDPGQTA